MTKEEAKEMLTNTKVYVNGKSKEIQEKLFEIGFSYTFVNNAHHFPFIYLNDDFYLRVGKDMTFFKKHHFREVSAEDILNIKIDEEFVPNEGDVIVTDGLICISDGTALNIGYGVYFARLRDYGAIYRHDLKSFSEGYKGDIRLATKDEKEIMLSELKRQGLFWNEETKELKKINKEHEFKPFDRVLVRDDEEERWRISLFAKKETDADFPYRCMGEVYSFCIPYEGNESLLGTSNSPKK